MFFDLTLSLLYLFTLLLGCSISLWTVYFTYTRQEHAVTRNIFIIQSTLSTLLLMAYIAIAVSQVEELTLLLVRLRFVINAFLAPFTLRFALIYSGASDGRWTRPMAAAFVFPIISSLVALFAPINWWFSMFSIAPYGAITADIFTMSGWFNIHALHFQVVMLLAMFYLFRGGMRAIPPYRSQAVIFVIGLILGNLISSPNLFRNTMGVWINFNGLGASVSVAFYALALLRYSFTHIVPIAYETIVNTMDTAILVLDKENTVVTLNPAARKTMKLTDENVNGKPLKEVFPPFIQLRDSYGSVYQAQAEIPFLDRIFEVQISPLYGSESGSQIVGRSIMWRDITERKQAERERERMITDLEAYSHTVAHDLKNPLHMMMGMNQMLSIDLPDAAPHIRQYLDLQMQSGMRMRNIIQDLLFLAQVRAQSEIVPVPLAMTPMVKNVLIGLESEIQLTEAVIDVQDPMPEALGIEAWLEQVWTNFLSNALKYGGTPPLVRVRAEAQSNGMIRFSVQDNGAGLTEAQQAKLFRQFVRLEPDRAPGTGLGLSIVKRIIERLGGQVGVICPPNMGCTFYFTLPAAPTLSIS